MVDPARAEKLAAAWFAAWNARDLPRVLALYRDDCEMISTHIPEWGREPSGVLRGKEAVAAYWTRALAANTPLHFEPEGVFCGVASVVLVYRTGLRRAAEVLELDETGKIARGNAHYLRSLDIAPITP